MIRSSHHRCMYVFFACRDAIKTEMNNIAVLKGELLACYCDWGRCFVIHSLDAVYLIWLRFEFVLLSLVCRLVHRLSNKPSLSQWRKCVNDLVSQAAHTWKLREGDLTLWYTVSNGRHKTNTNGLLGDSQVARSIYVIFCGQCSSLVSNRKGELYVNKYIDFI